MAGLVAGMTASLPRRSLVFAPQFPDDGAGTDGRFHSMTVQAPTLGDVQTARFDTKARALAWLRGIGVRQVRLATGLIMFTYIFSHFFNHALGNISYDLMQGWLWYHLRWWRIPLVNTTLYTAA